MTDDPELDLAARIDELSPHQRAWSTVLRLWMRVSVPSSIVLALVLAAIFARSGPGSINPLILLGTYFGIGVPTSIASFVLQERARKAIARRLLAQLDAPARGAVSGRESPTGFLGIGDDDKR